MIANARVARNKECRSTGFQLLPPLPTFVVLIVDTRDNGVLRLDNRFDPLSKLVHLKEKKRGGRRRRNRERWKEEKKEKWGEVCRYFACCFLLRSISMYIMGRETPHAILAASKKRKKGEKSGGGGEGIIANREKYEFAPGFFRDSCVANSKRINLCGDVTCLTLSTSGKFA